MAAGLITIAIILVIVGGAILWIIRSREPDDSGSGGGSGPSNGDGRGPPQPRKD